LYRATFERACWQWDQWTACDDHFRAEDLRNRLRDSLVELAHGYPQWFVRNVPNKRSVRTERRAAIVHSAYASSCDNVMAILEWYTVDEIARSAFAERLAMARRLKLLPRGATRRVYRCALEQTAEAHRTVVERDAQLHTSLVPDVVALIRAYLGLPDPLRILRLNAWVADYL